MITNLQTKFTFVKAFLIYLLKRNCQQTLSAFKVDVDRCTFSKTLVKFYELLSLLKDILA